MARLRPLLAAALLVNAACEIPTTVLEWPAASEIRSVVVSVEHPGGHEAYALPFDPEAAFVPPLAVEGEAHLELLGYARTLEALGLDDGRLEPATDGAPLPVAPFLWRAEISGGAAGPWSTTATRSGALAGLRVALHPPPNSPCARVEEEQLIELGQSELQSDWLLEAAPGVVLVGVDRGEAVHRLDLTGPTITTATIAAPKLTSVARAPDDVTYFGGATGALYQADTLAPLHVTEIEHLPVPSTISRLVIIRSAPLLAHALTGEGSGWTFDAGEWTEFTPPGTLDRTLVRDDSGRALALLFDQLALLEWTEARGWQRRDTPVLFESLTWLPRNRALVAGSANGALLFEDAQGWRSEAVGNGLGISALAEDQDGFWFAGDTPLFGQYLFEAGLCPLGETNATSPNHLLVTTTGHIMASASDRGGVTHVHVRKRTFTP